MEDSYEFLSNILNTIPEHIAVIDDTGIIVFVNKSWTDFGRDNSCIISSGWDNINYLDECHKAAAAGDSFGVIASKGILSVINNIKDSFYMEYPCHSLEEKRWFMMQVTPLPIMKNRYFVITHQNITERKLAEEEVRNKAKIDGLTNIPNRRTFDEFLHEEWKRCSRLKKPLSLAIVDLDHFKLLNDTYGHQAGDKCLVSVGGVLKEFSRRPCDICARYGGEEFAIVWGDTPLNQAIKLSNALLTKIYNLHIENIKSPINHHLTASIGVAEITPSWRSNEVEIVNKADSLLYIAKEKGRNRVEG